MATAAIRSAGPQAAGKAGPSSSSSLSSAEPIKPAARARDALCYVIALSRQIMQATTAAAAASRAGAAPAPAPTQQNLEALLDATASPAESEDLASRQSHLDDLVAELLGLLLQSGGAGRGLLQSVRGPLGALLSCCVEGMGPGVGEGARWLAAVAEATGRALGSEEGGALLEQRQQAVQEGGLGGSKRGGRRAGRADAQEERDQSDAEEGGREEGAAAVKGEAKGGVAELTAVDAGAGLVSGLALQAIAVKKVHDAAMGQLARMAGAGAGSRWERALGAVFLMQLLGFKSE